jgi:hypothetical protein
MTRGLSIAVNMTDTTNEKRNRSSHPYLARCDLRDAVRAPDEERALRRPLQITIGSGKCAQQPAR